MIERVCILIFILLYVLLYNHADAVVNSTCSLSKETLTCNYIPEEIPDGVSSVNIKEFIMETEFDIQNELFQSKNWKKVKYLNFEDHLASSHSLLRLNSMTFIHLQKLEALRISCSSVFEIDPNAFKGLDNVKSLDVTGCIRLSLDILMKALNGSDKIPNLEQLTLSKLHYVRTGLNMNKTFFMCLAGKPLKKLDLSRTHMTMFDFNSLTDLSNLTIVNASRAVVDDFEFRPEAIQSGWVSRVDIDISYIALTSGINQFQSNTFANINIPDIAKAKAKCFLYARMLNITGINFGTEILFYNTKVGSVESFKTLTKQVVLRKINLKRFDVRIDCDNIDLSSIELIDLAENGIEYFHPSLLYCLRGLQHLDFSSNNLNAMREDNVELFGQFLNRSEELQSINLASNQLADIPEDFFEGSKNLMVINLSGNKLTQVHFKLHHLQYLSLIDLSDNGIKILDSITMKQLDSLGLDLEPNIINVVTKKTTSSESYTSDNRQIRMKGNPFLCDTCDTLSSVRWLASATITESRTDNLTCKGEGDTDIRLADAVECVQGICERKMNIIVLTITSLAVITICVSSAVFIYLKRKRILKQKRRKNITELLREDEAYFAVFLSSCNEDDDFVKENVIGPLNEGLQQLVRTDRNLVCLGDFEFRVGRYVHNESLRCIEQCAVFLCVVSDSYCNSRYCVEEFNQATQMFKPVILMIKGDVDVDLMTPAMQQLFRYEVRMLWEDNNGVYRLKTSWENVCESILDVATN
ncbi:hypothetical protein ACF0H5_021448 [Mactra antiquata]